MGLGQGAEFDILPYAISRYFGLRAFGAIYSSIFAAVTLGGAIGPFVMGMSFDATGSYSVALLSFYGSQLHRSRAHGLARAVWGMGTNRRAGGRG